MIHQLLGRRAECLLFKSADERKQVRVADEPEFCVAIQNDLDRLEQWKERNLEVQQRHVHGPIPGEE